MLWFKKLMCKILRHTAYGSMKLSQENEQLHRELDFANRQLRTLNKALDTIWENAHDLEPEAIRDIAAAAVVRASTGSYGI
jgi:predicted  nucleic acid-binding Zn-ribbon protein